MPSFAASDGIGLHYLDEGTGMPLLCLAGLTRNSQDFNHVAPHLNGVRLIRPDYRGRGLSDWADPSTYTLMQEAQDALGLLDHLGIDRAAILGTSRGGLIAMGIAAAAKDRLIGVALNDVGPEIAQEGLDTIATYIGRNPVQRTYEEAARARARAMKGFPNVPHARWLDEVRAQNMETPDGLVIRYDPRLAETFAATGAQQITDLWPFFDAMAGLPLALVRGENSELLTLATANEMARRRPDMIRAEIPDRGHVPFLDEHGALTALNTWLELCK